MDDDYLMSYFLMCNLVATVPSETTPLGFTRGLNKNGLWNETVGLYGSKGGYVVFCDGHTVWYDGSKPARFLKWDRSGYTSDIREAVPTGTVISCVHPSTTIKSPYNTEDTPAFIHTTGTGGD
jgi:hypothetical protein